MSSDPTARKSWLGLMARAPSGRVASLLQAWPGPLPEAADLRPPEIGSTMVQARAGGSGAPFNLGEMTVTRASLRLPCGTVGHGYVQGRRKADARAVALADALLQTGARDGLAPALLGPLAKEEAARRGARATKAAGTKVEFFTLARGED